MPEPDPGYIAALAAALTQANQEALIAAENGDNQLGHAVPGHPGLRTWTLGILRVGHHPLTPFAVEINALLADGVHVDRAFHGYAHRTHLPAPPGYPTHPTKPQWVACGPDDDGSVPITIAPTTSTGDTLDD
ncbi:hypothetical protein [Streptomyces sp. NPDC059076]|uniref:hypothetical protein n=1 Tax=unclassified Streptomyces TaxID=2593676 RepID=UPI0036B9A194